MKIIIIFFKGIGLREYISLFFGITIFLHISFRITNNNIINVYNVIKENKEERGIASIPGNISVPGVEEKLEEIKEVLEKKAKEK